MPEWPLDLRRRVEALAAAHRLQAALVERWQALAAADAAAVCDLAERLRLGENHIRDLCEWSEEIALRDGTTIAAVLESTPVTAALSRALGRNDAVKTLREVLRRLRFPRLAALEDQLAQRVRRLALPAGVRLVLPPNLQDTEIRVEIRAGDLAALTAAVDALRAAVQRPELAELFALMGEVP
jgi:hypothetical protein